MRFLKLRHNILGLCLLPWWLGALASSATALEPSARGGHLLPPGYLHTSGSQIVDEEGAPVRISAVAWAGSEGRPGCVLQGLWQVGYDAVLDSIKADGFNTVRIPWTDAALFAVAHNGPNGELAIDFAAGRNSELRGLDTFETFKKIVAYAKVIGLKVIFDHHSNEGNSGQQPNGLWFDLEPGYIFTDGTFNGKAQNRGTVTEAEFIRNWMKLAAAFAKNPTVIGFDLHNEPSGTGNATPHPSITWGTGNSINGKRTNDIHAMYEKLGNLLQRGNPNVLMIVEGPQYYTPPPPGYGMDTRFAAPQGNLSGVAAKPVRLRIPNRVVYSVHEYPNEVAHYEPLPDHGPDYVQRMNTSWGYLVRDNIAPVFVGEMGSSMSSAGAKAWVQTLLPYLNGQQQILDGPKFTGHQQPISAAWWLAGKNDGDPRGTQTRWGVGNYIPEVQSVTDQLLFRAR